MKRFIVASVLAAVSAVVAPLTALASTPASTVSIKQGSAHVATPNGVNVCTKVAYCKKTIGNAGPWSQGTLAPTTGHAPENLGNTLMGGEGYGSRYYHQVEWITDSSNVWCNYGKFGCMAGFGAVDSQKVLLRIYLNCLNIKNAPNGDIPEAKITLATGGTNDGAPFKEVTVERPCNGKDQQVSEALWFTNNLLEGNGQGPDVHPRFWINYQGPKQIGSVSAWNVATYH